MTKSTVTALPELGQAMPSTRNGMKGDCVTKHNDAQSMTHMKPNKPPERQWACMNYTQAGTVSAKCKQAQP